MFTKIGRELAVAVREGGSADPSSNSKLRDCIAKAKANNVPNDNIERIIEKRPLETMIPANMRRLPMRVTVPTALR